VNGSVGDSSSTGFSRISHRKSRVSPFVLPQIQARNLEPALRWVEEKQDALSAAVAAQSSQHSTSEHTVIGFFSSQIQSRNLEPALRWVEEKRGALSSARQSYESFEFQLHRLQFLRILTEQGTLLLHYLVVDETFLNSPCTIILIEQGATASRRSSVLLIDWLNVRCMGITLRMVHAAAHSSAQLFPACCGNQACNDVVLTEYLCHTQDQRQH